MTFRLWLLLLPSLFVCSQSTTNCTSTQANEPCYNAKPSWTFSDIICCTRDIEIQVNNPVVDLSSWSQAQIKEAFQKKNKALLKTGINLIDNGNVSTLDIQISPANDTVFTIKNNLNLIRVDFTVGSNEKPVLMISGNRILKENALEELRSIANPNNSYIQPFKECDLNNTILTSISAVLKDCNSVYGDLIIDGNTSITPIPHTLEQLHGCLVVTGTAISTWDDLPFLKNLQYSDGGCRNKHKIKGNKNLCLQPEEEWNLKNQFTGMTIANNQKCAKKCSGQFVMEKRVKGCEIITDNLIIENLNKAQSADLRFLESIEEIKGTLSIVSTKISNFTSLKNLKSLNSDSTHGGALVEVKFNPLLVDVVLPNHLNHSKASPSQQAVYLENNPLLKDTSSLQKIFNYTKDEEINLVMPLASTIEPTLKPKADSKNVKMNNIIQRNINLLIIVAVACLTCSTLLGSGIAYFCFYKGFVSKSRWKYVKATTKISPNVYLNPIRDKVGSKDEFYLEAEQHVKENQAKINNVDGAHRENTQRSKITFPNHYAPAVMATEFAAEDYETNKDQRASEEFNVDTSICPVEKDGRFGLAFIKSGGYPKEVAYAYQCDRFAAAWNNLRIQPVYVDTFKKTAERMSWLAVRQIGEHFIFPKNKRDTTDFTVDFGHFDAEVIRKNVASEMLDENLILGMHVPDIYSHRYVGITADEKRSKEPYKYLGYGVEDDGFITRLVTTLLRLPENTRIKISAREVRQFLEIIIEENKHATEEAIIKEASNMESRQSEVEKTIRKSVAVKRATKKRGAIASFFSKISTKISGKNIKQLREKSEKRAKRYNINYAAQMDGSHVRIVGELRGDFNALRQILSIPSNLGETDRPPFLQYSWVFLGNYASGHIQSLETVLLLLGLQYLFGEQHFCLLRGAFEYQEMFKESGFDRHLKERVGSMNLKITSQLCRIFTKMPLSCLVLGKVLCSHSGFTETDAKLQFADSKNEIMTWRMGDMTSTHKIKAFSLPNVTVQDYFENVDSMAGYYYGERTLDRISDERNYQGFVMTTPMEYGFGSFGDYYKQRLYAISSVRGFTGPAGVTTKSAVVMEINGKTMQVGFNVILEDGEEFEWDLSNFNLTLVKANKSQKSTIKSSKRGDKSTHRAIESSTTTVGDSTVEKSSNTSATE